MKARLALNLRSSSIGLPSAGITAVYHYAWRMINSKTAREELFTMERGRERERERKRESEDSWVFCH
jgi:hypothetical protein